MAKTASSDRKMTLENFTPFQMKTTHDDIEIASYLEQLAQERLSPLVGPLELPSMSELSSFFDCSFLKVYDAFRLLRERGYDYQFSSVDGTMLVWRQPHFKIKEC
jgi:hypothetical protein